MRSWRPISSPISALSAAELGLLTAAYLGAFALFQLPLGVLLDRYGPRRVQAGLLGIACLGCLGFAAAPGFVDLVPARAVIGLGFSAGLMAGYKASSLWVPAERRSLVNAAIMATGALGIVFATEPTEYLVSLIGWRSAFMVFAALTLAVALFIFLAVPKRERRGDPDALATQLRQLLRILQLGSSGGSSRCWHSPPACRSHSTDCGPAHGFAM